MGDNTLPDQVVGMTQLAQRYPWIDLERAGIYGHSGGGYAAADAMFRYPDGSSFFSSAKFIVDLLGLKVVTCPTVCGVPDYMAGRATPRALRVSCWRASG
jgi:hypothetical protein